LKQFFLHIVVRIVGFWNLALLPALAKLGFWGAGAIALLDSSSIPVPMDAYLAVAVWHDKSRFLLYILLAAAGSALGGLLPYALGRAGGELFLLKRINRERFELLRAKFERQEFLAVMIPSMMPPPAPWKLFIFASGVFEMRIVLFLLAVFVGRLLRWLILALLVLKLGPGASEIIAHHALSAILIVGALAIVGFGVWWFRKKRAATLA
jgi:membrane protein YqaA with SNARE-associated domain